MTPFDAPNIDYQGLSPIIALTAGLVVVLLSAVAGSAKRLAPGLTLISLATAAGLLIWNWDDPIELVNGAMRLDGLAITISLVVIATAAAAVLISAREPAADEAGRPEYHALLLGSVLGMVMLSQAQSLITLFVAIEILSIPLYVLCATNMRAERSLESGLKYLIVGSLGSAVLLYGLAFLYGGSGSTSFQGIADGIAAEGLTGDPLILIGIAMVAVGMAFKVSIAPFHQWTPDVYEGAPTPITAFMAVATKAAAFAVFARFFIVALGPSYEQWQPALAVLAAITIIVGNVGAIKQTSLKRMLGYSGVAQAGYMLIGIIVLSEGGIDALVFYMGAYLLMNLAAFGVIAIRERETSHGDGYAAIEGIGKDRPLLAWALTIAMLGLAGLPGTAGFMGKVFLIEAAVGGNYTWLAVILVIGSMISLAYYMKVIAAVWMKPAPRAVIPAEGAIAGAAPEADALPVGPGLTPEGTPSGGRCPLVVGSIALTTAAIVFFGIYPSPLVDFAINAGQSISALLGGG